jgi:hypothetical protein
MLSIGDNNQQQNFQQPPPRRLTKSALPHILSGICELPAAPHETSRFGSLKTRGYQKEYPMSCFSKADERFSAVANRHPCFNQ